MRVNWRVGQQVTMPLLMNASRTAIKYGQALESFAIVDPEGMLRFKSTPSVRMSQVRDEVVLALSALPEEAVELVAAAGWEHALPDTAVVGAGLEIDAVVRPAVFSMGGEVIRVVADLSGLGGGAEVPLVAADDGTYRLQGELPLDVPHGLHPLEILVEQQTPDGPVESRLSQMILVVPSGDLPIFGAGLNEEWSVRPTRVELAYEREAASGREVMKLVGGAARWSLAVLPGEAVPSLGYRALRFAFHPGDAEGGFVDVAVKGTKTRLTDDALDLGLRAWQDIEVPLAWDFSSANKTPNRDISSVLFTGNLAGTFYLSDLRLVSAREAVAPTAVRESYQATTPEALSLDQNFPNPFNSETVIRFALPAPEQVELSVYNMLGQQVAVLLRGPRAAGVYAVRWDGRDRTGRALATGVYFYRLATGGREEIRKLLLLR